ncbi:hypothetical protein CF326_g8387 [Tilletia indica]|nr:hypothetical protein CF326_g8387 [Tilletia indica]
MSPLAAALATPTVPVSMPPEDESENEEKEAEEEEDDPWMRIAMDNSLRTEPLDDSAFSLFDKSSSGPLGDDNEEEAREIEQLLNRDSALHCSVENPTEHGDKDDDEDTAMQDAIMQDAAARAADTARRMMKRWRRALTISLVARVPLAVPRPYQSKNRNYLPDASTLIYHIRDQMFG